MLKHWGNHKVLTYVEYRAVSDVFQIFTLPHPLSTQRVCPPPERRGGGGGTHSPGGEGVGGGSIFWKTPDIGLASYSLIPLRRQPYLLILSQLHQSGNCHHHHASYFQSLRKSPSPIFTPLIPFCLFPIPFFFVVFSYFHLAQLFQLIWSHGRSFCMSEFFIYLISRYVFFSSSLLPQLFANLLFYNRRSNCFINAPNFFGW